MRRVADISVLVAGLGSVGRRHLGNLISLGVGDIRLFRTGRATMREDLPAGLATFTDLEEALAGRPDAVIVANPTALHLPVSLAAARAGAHLLIEKPLAGESEDPGPLAREVAERRLKVLVGYQFRHHPVFRRVHAWLAEGRIGRVIAAHAQWGEYLPGWHPWEDHRQGYAARADLGGGVLLTLSHPLDYLRWLCGEVEGVAALLARQSGLTRDVEDTALLTLRFVGGAVGTVRLDYVQHPPQHSLQIVGELGSIHWNQQEGRACLQTLDGRRPRVCAPPAGWQRNTMFRDELAHFLDCIAHDREPACTLADGVAVLSVIHAARRSAGRWNDAAGNAPVWSPERRAAGQGEGVGEHVRAR